MSNLYSSSTQGSTESFLRRPHSSRDLLGACLADSSFPDGAKKRLIQSVSLQFPCHALLHQWGKEDSPNCPSSATKGNLWGTFRVAPRTDFSGIVGNAFAFQHCLRPSKYRLPLLLFCSCGCCWLLSVALRFVVAM